jgi:hypothetical protein
MLYNDKFGPAAQTPQQRKRILQQLLAIAATAQTKYPAHAPGLHQRYVAGELSWAEVCLLRAAPVAQGLG